MIIEVNKVMNYNNLRLEKAVAGNQSCLPFIVKLYAFVTIGWLPIHLISLSKFEEQI